MRLDGRHDRARDVLVEVRAADAACDDPNDDVARLGRGRLGYLLDPEVAGGVKTECPHSSPGPCDQPAALPVCRHGTMRSARSRAKRSVNEDSLSRTPRKPSRLLRP